MSADLALSLSLSCLSSANLYSLLRRGGGHEQSWKCDSYARNEVRSSKTELWCGHGWVDGKMQWCTCDKQTRALLNMFSLLLTNYEVTSIDWTTWRLDPWSPLFLWIWASLSVQVYKSNGGWTEGEAVAQMHLSRVTVWIASGPGRTVSGTHQVPLLRPLTIQRHHEHFPGEKALSSVLCQVNNLQSVFNRYDVKHSGLIASKERGT